MLSENNTRSAAQPRELDGLAGLAPPMGEVPHSTARTLPARRLNQLYYFTFGSALGNIETKIGEAHGPRGVRLYTTYALPSRVVTRATDYELTWQCPLPDGYADPQKFEELYGEQLGLNPPLLSGEKRSQLESEQREWIRRRWTGIEGTILSGADFMLVRPDGVIELDGRVTIRANDETLIDTTYRGLIDLEQYDAGATERSISPTEAAVSAAYQRFISGEVARAAFPLQLSLGFETNTGPWSTDDAEDATWTKPSQARHRGNVWKYSGLVRRQFTGFGAINFTMQRGKLPQPERIEIDVVELLHEEKGNFQ